MEFELVGRRIREAFGDRVDEVIIFGSRVRGDYREDSDLDVLLILRDGIRPEDWGAIGKLSAELTLELGVSVMIVPHTSREDSLYTTAKTEGVAV
ncbi:nucleotidyltransferase family protein [Thermococcus sp. Bubb.Bath]|uniref:nucleotidyltransferase family protein n=1 Tax=Thermococcus sp. Bubb.Bath TaxID=1638242 RepID=UPI00143B9FEB|nr:nucleotidyltransferase domain-containing protein [Thermococcus sp. Bubb.Bath]NJF24575.1 nucleotidyltransferase domain-containing protein [Thermococcus sp. Bubb.Bath]